MCARRKQNRNRKRKRKNSKIFFFYKDNTNLRSSVKIISLGLRYISSVSCCSSLCFYWITVSVSIERECRCSVYIIKSQLWGQTKAFCKETEDSASTLHPAEESCETINLINPMVSHLTVTSGLTCGTLLTSSKPQSDTRSGQGLNGCVGPC